MQFCWLREPLLYDVLKFNWDRLHVYIYAHTRDHDLRKGAWILKHGGMHTAFFCTRKVWSANIYKRANALQEFLDTVQEATLHVTPLMARD